jgi:hypothetical protein
MFEWFDAKEEEQFGKQLAALFIQDAGLADAKLTGKAKKKQQNLPGRILQQIDQYKLQHKLNVYKKSKFGNAFLWALLEAGMDNEAAKELTKELLVRL